MWEVYRDGNVKAYKQFESVPSPNYHNMKITLKVIALICLSLFMYYVSIQSFMHKQFFDGTCYFLVAITALILSAIESEPKNK